MAANEEKARQRSALKAAQIALQGVADENVAAAFAAVEKVIAEFRGVPTAAAPAPVRQETTGQNRMERGGKNRAE